MTNIFDARGMLRDDLENVTVPPERRPVLDALIAAVRAADAAEAEVKALDAAVADAVKVHDEARAAMPKHTFLDEWRAASGKPSLRDTWPPERASMAVDGAAHADGDKGDFPPSPQAGPVHESHEVLRRAEAALDAVRYDLRQAKTKLATTRGEVGTALANYNQSAPTITPEQNVRNWIASNQERRALLAEARQLPFRPTVTQTARAMGGGGHGNDIRTRRGGGAAYRRGPGGVQAFTKSQAQTIAANKIREARAAKLPAER